MPFLSLDIFLEKQTNVKILLSYSIIDWFGVLKHHTPNPPHGARDGFVCQYGHAAGNFACNLACSWLVPASPDYLYIDVKRVAGSSNVPTPPHVVHMLLYCCLVMCFFVGAWECFGRGVTVKSYFRALLFLR